MYMVCRTNQADFPGHRRQLVLQRPQHGGHQQAMGGHPMRRPFTNRMQDSGRRYAKGEEHRGRRERRANEHGGRATATLLQRTYERDRGI